MLVAHVVDWVFVASRGAIIDAFLSTQPLTTTTMDSPKPSTGGTRRHGRNISHPIPARATAGPLDAAEDPLSDAPKSVPVRTSSELPPFAPDQQPTPPPARVAGDTQRPSSNPSVNLKFLQDAKIYHLLGTEDVADAFLNSESQPPLDATLPDLLQQGHFRRAAETARRTILQCSPEAADQIFPLLYTRLACLVLVSRTDFAAEEAVPLTEVLARNPAGTQDLVPLIPWELRILLVRLQSIGLPDGGRRAIMSLYALASEVRARLAQARSEGNEGSVQAWSERLQDIGLRVCDTLVEMGELETAYRHLDTLTTVDPEELAYRKALLRVRVGDVVGAQQFIGLLQTPVRQKGLGALIRTALDGGADALDDWQTLIDEFPGHELFAQNAAVSMLYAGHVTSARELLQDMVRRVPMFPTLLFNLSTIYELCTERAPEQKANLVRVVAAKPAVAVSGGWERSNFEFKL